MREKNTEHVSAVRRIYSDGNYEMTPMCKYTSRINSVSIYEDDE